MKILPVEAKLFRASILLDMTKLITAFRSLVKAPDEAARVFGTCLLVRKCPSSVIIDIIHHQFGKICNYISTNATHEGEQT